jgi:hypothetical protein
VATDHQLSAAQRQHIGQVKGGHAAQAAHPGLAQRAGRAGAAVLMSRLSDPHAFYSAIAKRRWAKADVKVRGKRRSKKVTVTEPSKPTFEWL